MPDDDLPDAVLPELPITSVRWRQGEPRLCQTRPPLSTGHPMTRLPCIACLRPLGTTEPVTLLVLGPADTDGARERAAAGRWGATTAIVLHASCAGPAPEPLTTEPAPEAPAMGDSIVVEEWRVTGQPGDGFEPYDFTWRSDDLGGPDAEVAAWTFVDRVAADWTDTRVRHRTITSTLWTDATRPDTDRLKPAPSCRLCGRWLEGEWNRSTDLAERAILQRLMDQGRCDVCPPRSSRG